MIPIKAEDDKNYPVVDATLMIQLRDNYEVIGYFQDFFTEYNSADVNFNAGFIPSDAMSYNFTFNDEPIFPIDQLYLVKITIKKIGKNNLKIFYKKENRDIKMCKNDFLFPFCNFSYTRRFIGAPDLKQRKIFLEVYLPDEFELDTTKSTFNTLKIGEIYPKNGTITRNNIITPWFKTIKKPLKDFNKIDENKFELFYNLDRSILAPSVDLTIRPKGKYKILFFLPISLFFILIIFNKKISIKLEEIKLKGLKFSTTIKDHLIEITVVSYLFYLLICGFVDKSLLLKISDFTLLNPIIYLLILVGFFFLIKILSLNNHKSTG